jgi:soluble lytic murein transglycosylase-like protein
MVMEIHRQSFITSAAALIPALLLGCLLCVYASARLQPIEPAREAESSLSQASGLVREHKALARDIEERHKADSAVVQRVIPTAYRAGEMYGLSPTLVLAVIAVESRFDPDAVYRGARGLMQVVPRWHPKVVAEMGGGAALFDIEKNILAGTRILDESISRAGNVTRGLVRYNASEKAAAYSRRVLAEQKRLEEARRTAKS